MYAIDIILNNSIHLWMFHFLHFFDLVKINQNVKTWLSSKTTDFSSDICRTSPIIVWLNPNTFLQLTVSLHSAVLPSPNQQLMERTKSLPYIFFHFFKK